MKKNLLTATLLLSFIFSYSQASLVKDIQTGSTNGIDINIELFKYNNKVLFKAFGNELSVSDGTTSGTEWINIGTGSANPSEFTLNTVTNEVFFAATGPSPSDINDRELRKTNGLASGTNLVYDFTPSNGWSSKPTDLCESNGIIFCKISPIASGDVIGFTDGTASGSGLIDVNPGFGSFPRNFFAYNGKAYFSAIGPFVRRELYATDGTQTGTSLVKDIHLSSDSDPENFIIFNNKLYFTADDGVHGRELWVTDGTTNGTQLVVDVNNGPTDSNIQNLTVYSNKLYFSADSSNSGNEIHYITTSGSLILYKDINPGSASSNPSNFKVFNGQLYFNADNGSNGTELWRADGSIFGIGLFKDINPTGSSNPQSFQQYNGNLYFAADDGANGEELWMTDGTSAGTLLVADINPGVSGCQPRSLVAVGDNLLFHADDGTNGRELWKYFDPALSVSDFNNLGYLKLAPNPTTDSFSLTDDLDVNKVFIYSIQGKLTKQFNASKNGYNIEDLSPGLYFVEIKANNNKETLKLIKQ